MNDPTPTPAQAGDREVQRVAVYGILISLLLVAIKGSLAIFSRSLVLTATAVDSAVDVVGAIVLWAGLRLSARKSSRFPFGLYKIENVLQVIVAILIFVGAWEIGAQALAPQEEAPVITWWVIAGVVVSIAITLAYSLYATSRGRRTSSPALVADGKHRLVDVMSGTLALVAVASTFIGFDIDRWAAFPILAIVVYSGWGLLTDGMKVLLDASVDSRTLRLIEETLEADPLVVRVRELTARSAGRYVFVEAIVTVRTGDLEKAHAAADRLEAGVRDELPGVDHMTLHLEPQRTDVLSVCLPLAADPDRLSDEFGSAPRFAFVKLRTADGTIMDKAVRDNPHQHDDRQKGIVTAEWLVGFAVDVLLVTHEVKKGPAYVFRDAGVEVRHTDQTGVDDALGELAAAVAPYNDEQAPPQHG
jgi:cation diffusion facilitator family transporter